MSDTRNPDTSDQAGRVYTVKATAKTIATIEWCLREAAENNGIEENEAEAAAVLAIVQGWRP